MLRQSSVVGLIWELRCASTRTSCDKSRRESLAFERCGWGKGRRCEELAKPGVTSVFTLMESHSSPLIHSHVSPGHSSHGLALCPFPDTSGWEMPELEARKPHSGELSSLPALWPSALRCSKSNCWLLALPSVSRRVNYRISLP